MDGKQKRTMARVAAFLSVGVIYRFMLLALAGVSFRKGHWFLGVLGFIFPAVWVAGALLPRKDRDQRS
jgi:hypothetical protein